MKIYWYWPFPHKNENKLARELIKAEDKLVVQSLRTHLGERITATIDSYEIHRVLPESTKMMEGSIYWFYFRLRTYIERVRLRRRIINSEEFDVCFLEVLNHVVDWWDLKWITFRVPTVIMVHDIRPHQRRFPPLLENAILKRMYSFGHVLVVYHPSLKNRLVTEFAVDADRIEVVRHPIPEILPAPLIDPSIKSSKVLFFGTFRRNKGIEVLLSAIKLLGENQNIVFHFAGRGVPDLEHKVKSIAEKMANVTCELGFIDTQRKDALFREAGLLVLPYTSFSSQSGVLADSYAYRVPVIVTDVGAIGETVRTDGTGWVIPASDPTALAHTLTKIMDEKNARLNAAKNMDRVCKASNYQYLAERIREIYKKAIFRYGSSRSN